MSRTTKTLQVLNNIQIAAPCPARWDEMLPIGEPGEDKVRHCGDCKLNVYNVAGLDSVEVRELLIATEGTACLQLYRRADGTVLTRDCPEGLAARAVRFSRNAAYATAASLLAVFGLVLAFLLTPSRCEGGGPEVSAETPNEFAVIVKEKQLELEEKIEPVIKIPDRHMIRGKIAMPRDWKRDLE